MKIKILLFFLAISLTAQSQILISLLLGDKLNTGKIEFGLDGGVNFSDISRLDQANFAPRFNLGFYFDMKLFKNPKLMFNTGVMVKSMVGAIKIPVYPIGNHDLDSAFLGGTIDRRLSYFHVPLTLKYRFENRFHIKGGLQLGLMYNALDRFENSLIETNDLKYDLEVTDDYKRIDAGFTFGFGYKAKGDTGMSYNVNFYQGLNPIMKDSEAMKMYNQSFYLSVGIPIGAAPSEKE